MEIHVQQCAICQHARHNNSKVGWPSLAAAHSQSCVARHQHGLRRGAPLSEGYNVILAKVDCYSKYAHFVSLCHPPTATKVSVVFLDNVVNLHGMSQSIVTGHDKVFTSCVWKDLYDAHIASLLNGTPPANRWADLG